MPGIALASDINISTIERESFNKILPESHEVFCNIILIVDGDIARREACRYWLIDIDLDKSARSTRVEPGDHAIDVRLVHDIGFFTGRKVPDCHRNGPFSWKRPSKDEQPGPPFSQMVTSFEAAGFSEGKNQNHNRLWLFAFESIDSVPA